MAIVAHAFRVDDLGELAGTTGSGFLVPAGRGPDDQGGDVFLREVGVGGREAGAGLLLLRTSVGRHREEATLQQPDEALVAESLAELAALAGLAAPPVASHVQRWGGALPQYAVGHLDRVAGSGPTWPRCRGWRSAGRRTTAWASRRWSARPAAPRLRSPGQNEEHSGMTQGTRHQRDDPLHDVVGLPAA